MALVSSFLKIKFSHNLPKISSLIQLIGINHVVNSDILSTVLPKVMQYHQKKGHIF